jgi:hypothetical protein
MSRASDLFSLELELSSSNRVYNALVLGEPVPVLFQRSDENFIFIYCLYKLSITIKMENSAFCTYYYALGSAPNGLATQIACLFLFHEILGSNPSGINNIV